MWVQRAQLRSTAPRGYTYFFQQPLKPTDLCSIFMPFLSILLSSSHIDFSCPPNLVPAARETLPPWAFQWWILSLALPSGPDVWAHSVLAFWALVITLEFPVELFFFWVAWSTIWGTGEVVPGPNSDLWVVSIGVPNEAPLSPVSDLSSDAPCLHAIRKSCIPIPYFILLFFYFTWKFKKLNNEVIKIY